MKKALLLLMLFTRIPSGHAQTETYKNVDSTLYAYYRWCNNNIRDSVVLLKADTLFRLAGEKNDIRMQAVGLDLPFQTRSNPIPWINTWLVSDNVQVAPQEVEVSSYLVGQIDSEVNTDDLSDFQL